MGILADLRDAIALYYETNTEFALWMTVALVAAVLLLIMLASPAFRRFMFVVLAISLAIGVLLIAFGPDVARGL